VQAVPAQGPLAVLGRVVHRALPYLGLLALTLAAGCHVPGTASAPPPDGGRLTVAVVPGIDTAPLMIAAKEGLFAQHGVTVAIRDYPSVAAAYGALRRGTADVAAGDYTSFFYAIATRQASLTLIADGYDAIAGTMQLLTLPTSGINSPRALVGKVVATPEAQVAPYQSGFPYNIQTLAGESVLQSDGVNPANVSWREVAADQMIGALRNHQVSAILVTDPLIIQTETQLGAVEVLDACSGVTSNLPLSGYFSTTGYAGKHRGVLQAFQAALSSAQATAGQRSSVQPVLRGQHMTTLEAALVNVGRYPTFVNVGQVQRVSNLMYESGMITSPVSVRGLLLK
jgi:NitT/TauT family transport system substrate-binding protein